jgi:hypothetical protein
MSASLRNNTSLYLEMKYKLETSLEFELQSKLMELYTLLKLALWKKVLKSAGLQDCNRGLTPASTTPVGSDVDGAPFIEDWEYASIVGMLMYIEANTRPDVVYAVHQASRYTHDPRASHAVAIKRILRYIKETKYKVI